MELLYVLQGTAVVWLDGAPRHMGAEDLLLINLNRRHRVLPGEDALIWRLSIPSELLLRFLDRDIILF